MRLGYGANGGMAGVERFVAIRVHETMRWMVRTDPLEKLRDTRLGRGVRNVIHGVGHASAELGV